MQRDWGITMAISINQDECVACGACADACPQSVIEVEDVATVARPDDCIECGICVSECPSECITL